MIGGRREGHSSGGELTVELLMIVGEEVGEEHLGKTELITRMETTTKNFRSGEKGIGVEVEVVAIEATEAGEEASIRNLLPRNHLPI